MRQIVCTVWAFALPCMAAAQPASAIPATLPTQTTAASATVANRAPAARTAVVTWTGSALTVSADGESLRTVLLRISRATGMKVSGGVPDELVFGKYGPGPVQPVLADLFSGMSINMMLVNGSPTQPRELVLTARTGGPTPPAPSQPLNESENPADANLAQPHPGSHTSPDSFTGPPTSPPVQQQPNSAPSVGVPSADGATQSAPATTDSNAQPESPNGVRTPEQIFEELRRRQQGNTAPQQ